MPGRVPLYAWHLGDMRPVFDLIERYGDEIEFDLHANLSLDLLDFFAGRYTWDKLVRLISQLPWWSRYQLATADDDDAASAQLEREDEAREEGRAPAKPTRPQLSRWDPFEELRADMVDGFNNLAATTAGNRKKPKRAPRPETGRDRAQRARDHAEVTDLFDIFAPGR